MREATRLPLVPLSENILIFFDPAAAQTGYSVTEIKTLPGVPLSHPFVERLIGTLRRECLDPMLFWTATDLEAKVLDFQHLL